MTVVISERIIRQEEAGRQKGFEWHIALESGKTGVTDEVVLNRWNFAFVISCASKCHSVIEKIGIKTQVVATAVSILY